MATVNLGKIKLKWRGTWSSGGSYTADDVVEYTDGSVTSSYIAVASSSNQTPSSGGTVNSSYWNYAAKGQNASPTTTQGDLIVRGASADERLAIGAAGKVLKVNSGANGLEYGDGSVWTEIASGTGPSSAVTSIDIDNIFSNNYHFYKLFYSWAQDDWFKMRYIKADGSIESGNVYVGSGTYTKENSAGGPSRIGFTNQNYGYYNYWNSASDCPSLCEITYVDPYASNKETIDWSWATQVHVSNMYQQVFSNCNMNSYSVRGVRLFGSGNDPINSTNFHYLVLGAKVS